MRRRRWSSSWPADDGCSAPRRPPDGRAAAGNDRARRQRARGRLMPDRDGPDARVDHGERRGPCTTAQARQRAWMDHRRVLDAPTVDARPGHARSEPQATAEGAPYSRAELDAMISLAHKGIKELIVNQKRAIAALG